MPPTGYKGFAMPVWVLAATAVLKSAAVVASFIAVKIYVQRQGRQPVAISWLLDAGIVLLLIGQICVYWILRRKLFSRTWARLHVYLTVFVLLIIPLLIILVNVFITSRMNEQSYLRLFGVVNRVRLYLFWILLVAANIFFAANCIKSWRRTDNSFRQDIDAIGSTD